jgi:hypothetical protein
MEVKLEQRLNANLSIFSTPKPIKTDLRFLHKLKAAGPIETTLFGIDMASSESQCSKACE